MYSISEGIARILIPRVDHFFGLMGNGNAWFVDALDRLGHGIIPVRHEVASVAAADAYHRVSRRLAVATTTYGAGFTNTLTALADAALSRTPLILVVGTEPSTGPRDFDVDQQALARAVGVDTFTVHPGDVGEVTLRAWRHALEHRIPVVLEIPYDLAAAPAIDPQLEAAYSYEPAPGKVVDTPDVSELVKALSGAKHPLLLAGRGARGASQSIRDLADLLHADVATSAPARGLFNASGNFRDLGVCGGFAAEGSAAEIRRADVVLVLGAGLNQFTMAFGEAFGESARVFQVDLAAAATHPRVDDFQQGDAAAVSAEVLAQLHARGYEAGERFHLVADPQARPAGDELAPDGRLDPRSLMRELNQILPAEKLIATDGGHFIGWPNTYLDLAGPDNIVLLGTAFQSIGLGFPTAVGVAAAAGEEKLAVLVTGDGGGVMALADAETFIRTAHRGLVIVLNDAAYGAEIHQYGSRGLRETAMLIPEINFAAVLGALGAETKVVRELGDLRDFREWLERGEPGTYVLDCRISPNVIAPYMQEIISR
ncbi:Sulfoacetaldehyde acetyltransferase [Corynebacterium occultum]|uniref:acetolactate synthase n=1 Tax=Corynebacterium occultum TaxID=2675219 RepID=A0A6B8VMU0_9CORY|nr:thiamine pyrophosphate-binding protein [Corynebacterium occultum]QGU06822.1 Sulfoacetaldehyde acetyltransferase [Corynebacterium occultum]